MDSCTFIITDSIFLHAVMMLSQFSSIVWVFELKYRAQSVKQRVAATSSLVCSKRRLFDIYFPLIIKNYSELPYQKVLMDLKKPHCSPVFDCNKDQIHLPDLVPV